MSSWATGAACSAAPESRRSSATRSSSWCSPRRRPRRGNRRSRSWAGSRGSSAARPTPNSSRKTSSASPASWTRSVSRSNRVNEAAAVVVRARAEIALSLGVVALGVGVAAVTATLPAEGGYAGIGPNFIPAVVAGGVILLRLWLSFEAFTGGWRKRDEQSEVFEPSPFLWVSAGLFGHMLLIGWAGFVVAGTGLFLCVARGFGSRRPLRDLLIALALSVGVFLFFVKLLNLDLPARWLTPLLGGAGI